MKLSQVTRDNVVDSIQTFDELGREAFLKATGYGDSKVYQLRYRGRSYPSKAILGHAANLDPRDFFGGVAQTVPALQRLGFVVRKGHRNAGAVGITAIADRFVFPIRPYEVDPAASFASGSNRPGEIRGFAQVGHDVGVVAGELNEEAIRELEALAGSDVQVFVDSGAFSEVAWSDRTKSFVAVKPIEPAAWEKVLELYERLARALGSQLWIVAPDRVGDQAETLRRLARYAGNLHAIAELGARVLVPVQKGLESQAAFYAAACGVAGLPMIPALPCKKAATTVEDAQAFFAELDQVGEPWDPRVVHFLGLGPRNARVNAYLEAAGDRQVSLDSNWIRANVGRGTTPRRYTVARDIAKKALSIATPALVAELALLIALGGAA